MIKIFVYGLYEKHPNDRNFLLALYKDEEVTQKEKERLIKEVYHTYYALAFEIREIEVLEEEMLEYQFEIKRRR